MKLEKGKYFNRELSWLSFNYRVLQEAKNEDVPLIERLKFLAIFSSNLDEFYRVRVASYRHLMRLNKKIKKELVAKPKKLVKKINKKVNKQQQEFGDIFRNALLPALAKENVLIIDETKVNQKQKEFLRDYFKQNVQPYLNLAKIEPDGHTPFLVNKALYFAIKLQGDEQSGSDFPEHYILNIPSDKTTRFVVLPDVKKRHVVIHLDDIVRLSLDILFPGKVILGCFAIKLTRDAELYIEDELGDTVVEKIRKSLSKRTTGIPSRFLYDEKIPKEFLKFLKKLYGLKNEDLVPGGKYHNFNDFFGFPDPGKPNLVYEPFDVLPHRDLEQYVSCFEAIRQKDFMLHFPYQTYDYVIQFLKEAAADPQVESIKITLYRVSDDSKVAKMLLKAAKKGKEVVVFLEAQARFDERSNLFWGDKLIKAGAKVIYSFPEYKVHSKICLIERKEGKAFKRYAYLGTGNFNEKTAGIYCDHGLLTSDKNLTNEINKVFNYLFNTKLRPRFKYLLVAPFNMRKQFEVMIDNEIANARAGKQAKMILKMNSLEDRKMIDKLYEASSAGVKIKIIVRGICCLVPGLDGLSENIKVISIIDRYLEHGRIYIFHNAGDELIYLASADWMKRNLSKRVEVGFPLYDKAIKMEIKKIIKLQLKDNIKARKLNKTQSNPYKKSTSKKIVQAQFDFYRFLKAKHNPSEAPDLAASEIS